MGIRSRSRKFSAAGQGDVSRSRCGGRDDGRRTQDHFMENRKGFQKVKLPFVLGKESLGLPWVRKMSVQEG